MIYSDVQLGFAFFFVLVASHAFCLPYTLRKRART